MIKTLVLTVLISFTKANPISDHFNLHVVSINDFHARFDETNDAGGTCKDENCIGGLSRLYNEIEKIKRSDPNVIILNGGDNFQGTLWYSIFKWNVTQHFLNKFNFDAVVLGNHEFDDGLEGLIPFMKALNAPIVTANIDDTLEPEFQGLYTKSTIVERDGKRIGIVGVLTNTTVTTSSPGKLKFLHESASVNAEAERLVKEEGVFTVIVLSHCGYESDEAIAANATKKIGLIVGGHTHTLLYSGAPVPGPDHALGPFPTIVKRKDGNQVLIIQSSAYSKYFGDIHASYNLEGEVVDFSGNSRFLDHTVPQNKELNEELLPWKKTIDAMGDEVLGSTLVDLTKTSCYTQECLLGNFVTDAYVYHYSKKAKPGSWTYASLAIINPGGLRTDIKKGNITYNDLINAQPFSNTADVSELQGKHIKQLFENAVSTSVKTPKVKINLRVFQVSGIKIVIDLHRPVGQRVTSLQVLCNNCSEPAYEPLDEEKDYRIITPSFLTGNEGYPPLTHMKNTIIGGVDVDVIRNYLADKSPVSQKIEGRIEIIGTNEFFSIT